MSTEVTPERHPIEITSIDLLHVEVVHRNVTSELDEETAKRVGGDIKIAVNPDGSNLDKGILDIGMTVKVGMEEPAADLGFSIDIVGRFQVPVDPDRNESVLRWAKGNGFFLLIPFIREIVFSITKYVPSGPYIVPLLTLPDSYADQKVESQP